jgi:hypothetical protein
MIVVYDDGHVGPHFVQPIVNRCIAVEERFPFRSAAAIGGDGLPD